jgi:hypothetical protein
VRRHVKALHTPFNWTARPRRAGIGTACLCALALAAFLGISVPSAVAIDTCPNVVFRTGPSAKLPECRAYELVTPAFTGGKTPSFEGFLEDTPGIFSTNTVTAQGDSVVFQTLNGALSGFPGTGYIDRYRSRRTAQGWVTESISPGGDMSRGGGMGGVSSDHEYSTQAVSEPTTRLGPSFAGYGFLNVLRTPEGYEPLAEGSLGVDPSRVAQAYWITANATHVIFGAKKKLEPLASEVAPQFRSMNLYDRTPGGPTQVLSLINGASPPNGVTFLGASKSGNEVAFGLGDGPGTGGIFVRRNDSITEQVLPDEASFTFDGIFNKRVFYGDAEQSSRTAFISPFGNLYMYDLDEEKRTTIEGHDDASIVNVSEDGSHVYFVAKSALTGSEQNQYGDAAVPPAKGTGTLTSEDTSVSGVSASEGTFQPGMAISGEGIRNGTTIESVGSGTLTLSKEATTSGNVSLSASAPNLYVWSQGDESTRFIGTVAQEDVETSGANRTASINTWAQALATVLGAADSGRAMSHTRSTPTGSFFAFESTAQLTDFDNTERNAADCGTVGNGGLGTPGQGCDEVYRYDANNGDLTCVSCGPGSGPASGEARLQSINTNGGTEGVEPAAVNTPVESLTSDGSMVFFESTESLVPQDGNQTKDVYRWKEGGDVALISTGQGVGESALYGVTPDGSNVVFGTREKLVPQDENGTTVRFYDARVDGGFSPPEETVTEPCAGDACQGQAGSAPESLNISSASLSGQGNVAAKLRCAKHSRRVVRKGRESCRRKHKPRRRDHHRRSAAR